MEYTAADREQIASELAWLDCDTEQFHLGFTHRAPSCAPLLPLHRPLEVADLHDVDWTTFAPEVPQCECPDDGVEDLWYECHCRHCRVHATPRTVCQMVLALIRTRNFYTRLCRLPVLTCLYDYFNCQEQRPSHATIVTKWGQAQKHVLQHRCSWKGPYTEYLQDLPFAEDPPTGHELMCDWKLQPGDKTFLDEAVADAWLHYWSASDHDDDMDNIDLPDELHEEFGRHVPCNGAFWLPLPRFLREWRQLHPRGYRRWRRFLLDSFDFLIVRLLMHPEACFSGRLATCITEEIAVTLATYYLDHACKTPHSTDLMGDHAAGQALLASLPVCVWDRALRSDCPGWDLLERVLQDQDVLFLWPYWPGAAGNWPIRHERCSIDVNPALHGPEVVRMRFPLDFLAPFGREENRKQQQQQSNIPLQHVAAVRIHRFWRNVCCNPKYVHARRCLEYLLESDQPPVLGKRMRE